MDPGGGRDGEPNGSDAIEPPSNQPDGEHGAGLQSDEQESVLRSGRVRHASIRSSASRRGRGGAQVQPIPPFRGGRGGSRRGTPSNTRGQSQRFDGRSYSSRSHHRNRSANNNSSSSRSPSRRQMGDNPLNLPGDGTADEADLNLRDPFGFDDQDGSDEDDFLAEGFLGQPTLGGLPQNQRRNAESGDNSRPN